MSGEEKVREIRVLEEKHREVAAEIVRGTPRTKIAAKYGIGRETILRWLKDPLFVAYVNTLRDEIRAARRERLMPVTMKAAEAVEALLARIIADAATCENPQSALESTLRVLKIVAELEQDEAQAQPTPPLRGSIRKADPATIGGVVAVNPDERVPLLPATTPRPEDTHEE